MIEPNFTEEQKLLLKSVIDLIFDRTKAGIKKVGIELETDKDIKKLKMTMLMNVVLSCGKYALDDLNLSERDWVNCLLNVCTLVPDFNHILLNLTEKFNSDGGENQNVH